MTQSENKFFMPNFYMMEKIDQVLRWVQMVHARCCHCLATNAAFNATAAMWPIMQATRMSK